ncbi:MAG: FtsX-like permease family protein [Nostocoides sp.]
MLRASWKSLVARKLRLFMSAFAVILGVAFVAGAFIFTDTLGRAFDGIMTGSVGDVVVTPPGTTSDDGNSDSAGTTRRIPASAVAAAAGVPGAARADGRVTDFTTFVVGKNGKLIGGNGAPGIAVNHTGGPAAHGLEAATLDAGRWPTRSGEVVLDDATATTSGYLVGETVNLVTAGAQPRVRATLVGTMTYGGGGLVGASIALFDTETAQQLYLGGKDEFTDLWVTARSGVSQADLRTQVVKALPTGYAVQTGDAAAKAQASDIQQALGFITTFLLVFAGIALVVGSFLIVNTFSILVAQRSRELALFRALGAGRAQVARSVLFEAGIVGLVGSTLGLGLGFVLAVGIKTLFATFGLDLSGSSLVFEPRTVLAAYGVGMVVTLVAAYLPARRAGRVAPVAAMRDDVEVGESSLRRRVIFGAGLAVIGAAALGTGLFADMSKPMWFIGGGIFGVVLGVAMTSPLVGRPVIAALGALYGRAFGTVGRMAEQNAIRNPRRTAATASALMIGVTLVSMMTVLGASAKSSVDKAIGQEFAGDFVVSNAIGMPFSSTITKDVATVSGVQTVAPVRWYGATAGTDKDAFIAAVDPATLTGVLPVSMMAGSLAALRDGALLVEGKTAAEQHLAVGQTLTLVRDGHTEKLVVAGTYTSNAVITSPYLTTVGTATALGVAGQDTAAYVKIAPGASRLAVEQALDKTLADLPLVTVKDQAAYAAEQRAPIDQMLMMIYALLGLAIVIAVLGIVNTLGLSVIERTREIGLLRAIGLSRKQLRRMLALESTAIALLGASLGIILGVAFGIALQRALASNGIDTLTLPWQNLVLFLAIAAVVGVLAALWPGRRAARLDVLRALSQE